ncbi:MAG TPA: tail fiber domain-containing protein, partial [Panacibacter sp.]|nr:tail fiber domain-containing protein [Panacibacter sp.]
NISDGRYKKNIKSNVPGLDFINSLKPVTYTLDIDGLENKLHPAAAKNNTESADEKAAKEAKKKILYSGFVAQDVETSAKKLGYDFSGIDAPKNKDDLYGLRYAEFVVPLVKAVQELSKQNENLQQQVNELKALVTKGSAETSSSQSSIITVNGASLDQNMPNPFNTATSIGYTLPQKFTSAQLAVNDANGKLLKQVLLSGTGKGKTTIETASLAAGTYTYSLVIDGKLIGSKKMILVK